ncbi:transposase family protein [Salipiger abyssi]|uniref:transposase family protein n=1 Tax=Salipiger abyssi TaxID=1250539 RepID=UPI004058C4FA
MLIHARPVGGAAACPGCGEFSRRFHSHYQRRLADLPAHGRQVSIVLSARRIRRRSISCRTRILAERFPPAIAQA